jgi:hypothetical protein
MNDQTSHNFDLSVGGSRGFDRGERHYTQAGDRMGGFHRLGQLWLDTVSALQAPPIR